MRPPQSPFLPIMPFLAVLPLAAGAVAQTGAADTQTGADTQASGSDPDHAIAGAEAGATASGSAALQRLRLGPLAFEDWRGRDAHTDFVARSDGYTLFLAAGQVALRPQGVAPDVPLLMHLVGAAPDACSQALDRKPGQVHYYLGADPSQWHTGVTTHGAVRYDEVYPGIAVLYHGNRGEFEYDFVLAAGADPGAIRLCFEGGQAPALDEQGNLVVQLESGEVLHRRPVAYQEVAGTRVEVPARFAVSGAHVHFELASAWDPRHELVIDPKIKFITYFGGEGNESIDIEVDTTGLSFVGYTDSRIFPAIGPSQASPGNGDVFLGKIDPAGAQFIYKAYFGGRAYEDPGGFALMPGGGVAIAGITLSDDFPVLNALQAVQPGGPSDGFVAHFDGNGALVYSSYWGGNGFDANLDLTAGSGTEVVFTGASNSTDMITSPSAFARSPAGTSGAPDAFLGVIDVNAAGAQSFVAATFYGGGSFDFGAGVAVDANDVYLLGSTSSRDLVLVLPVQNTLFGNDDLLIAQFDRNLTNLRFASYLGGTNSEAVYGGAIGTGVYQGGIRVIVASDTLSANYPTTANAYDRTLGGGGDAVITVIDTLTGQVVYSTFFGGDIGQESAVDLRLLPTGNVVFTGFTRSPDFLLLHSLGPAPTGVAAYAAVLEPTLTRPLWSTTLGAANSSDTGEAVAFHPVNRGAPNSIFDIYVAGTTRGGFVATAGAIQPQYAGGGDAFLVNTELTFAAATIYNSGLAGTLGVPTLAASPPVPGNPFTIDLGSSMPVASNGLLAFGIQRTAFPIFGGFLLTVPIVTVPLTIPAAGRSVTLTVPGNNELTGVFDVQGFVGDPGAVRGVAMTPGLELQVGVRPN